MKPKEKSNNEIPANAPAALNGDIKPAEINFSPCPDEVARKAYFSYVNEGAPEGRAVQHWLDAEARLFKEREMTRTHTFHHHA